jgi:thymidylate kinase
MTGEPSRPLPVALALRDVLKRHGVAFVHWKSNDHLAQALAGLTDLDMYVDPSDRSAFEAAMAEIGALRMLSQPWARYPGVEDWLVFDDQTGRFLHLHQHYALVTGLKRVKHLALPWGRTLMANLRDDPASGWPIPSAEMELLILLVRIWAKMPLQRRWFGPKIPSHILRELDWLRRSSSEAELVRLLDELFPGLSPLLVLPVLKPGPLAGADIIPIAQELNRRLEDRFRMPWSAALLEAAAHNARMVFAKAVRWLFPDVVTGKTLPSGGAVIALIGSDGAGKSTVGRELHRWLRFKLDVHSYYMGSGDGGTRPTDLLRRGIRAIVQALKGKAERKPPSGGPPKRRKPAGVLGKTAELYQLVIMRHKVKLLRAARKLARGGSVVLTDRYPQTQFIGISDGPKIQEGASFGWAARRELRYYEEARALGPDLVVKLRVTPEVAHGRKPDHDPGVMARKIAIVDALEFPQARVAVLDATRPLHEVILAAKRAIWAELTRTRA